jgi:hypothetical protein
VHCDQVDLGGQRGIVRTVEPLLGTRLNETLRERAEQLAGLALLALALLLALEKLT